MRSLLLMLFGLVSLTALSTASHGDQLSSLEGLRPKRDEAPADAPAEGEPGDAPADGAADAPADAAEAPAEAGVGDMPQAETPAGMESTTPGGAPHLIVNGVSICMGIFIAMILMIANQVGRE